MPSPCPYQQETSQALLELFLEATGQSLPAHSKVKSASTISRFLNQHQWPTRQVIRLLDWVLCLNLASFSQNYGCFTQTLLPNHPVAPD